MDRRFQLLIRVLRLFTGVHFDALMLARHKGIDSILSRHIDSGRVTQVIELAAGLSARGWRFKQKYGDRITYIETDLPKMAALKQQQLGKAGLLTPGHRVATLNVLHDGGPESLAGLVKTLDPGQGLAIISEGLFSYLDPASAAGTWRRIAQALKQFPFGVYMSDTYLRKERYGTGGKFFAAMIQRAVRGRLHTHFETLEGANETLRAAGFGKAVLHETSSIPETREYSKIRGGERVRVLEAQV